MQYLVPACVAMAIGANARPALPSGLHWDYPPSFGGPSLTGVSFPTGLVPTGTGVVPGPTAPYHQQLVQRKSSEDDDDDNSGTSSATKSSSVATSTTAAITSAPPSSSKSGSSDGKIPASSGTSVLKAAQTIAAGESFDGGMVAFDRGASCTGQTEGSSSDAVFYLEEGASLSNIIIGPNQIEGVHCFGRCTLTNVWWSAVCEDAFTIKEQSAGGVTTIKGGGAYGAEDKVLQHNGGGTLSVSGFTVDNFGKLYRSCGNCKSMAERHVILDDITASSGSSLVGINSNYGDTAKLINIVVSGVKDICVEYKGNDRGAEPEKVSSGPSEACGYTESDITSS